MCEECETKRKWKDANQKRMTKRAVGCWVVGKTDSNSLKAHKDLDVS